jgi:carboxyl-terminal processing protease
VIRLTTARYFTPNGRSIQAQGITPDISVPDLVVAAGGRKVQPRFMRERDLEHHLPGDGEKKEAPQAIEKPPEKTLEAPPEVSKKTAAETQEDPPLERALDLLKTWKIFNKIAKEKAS